MVFYDNCGLYLESKKTLKEQIVAIDQVILAMNSALVKAATGADVSEYQLNDGQTIIKVINRGVKGITDSIEALRRLRQNYINEYNGRVFKAHDSSNFRTNYGSQF